jgi:mannitol/fructose-specific phosphotransferase system IIA component (Ntr-type)
VVHCTSADVPSSPVTRVDQNVAAALTRARRDLRASDIVTGWGAKPTAQDRLFGSFLDHLLEGRDFTLWMARLRVPLNTMSRLVLCVPPLAVREPGFAPVVHVIKRMASRLGARFVIHVVRSEEQALAAQLDRIKPELAHQCRPLDGWAGLEGALDGEVSDRDLLILYCARPGSLAYRSRGEQLAQRLAARFAGTNLLVVYPGEPGSTGAIDAVALQAPSFLRRGRIVLGLDQLSFQQAVRTLIDKGLAGAERAREAEARVLTQALIASAVRLGNRVVLLHTSWTRSERAVLLGTSRDGITRAEGEPPLHLVFAVLSPIGYDPQSHLNLLADIARIGANPELVERAMRAERADDVLAALAGRPAPAPEPLPLDDDAAAVPLAEP